MTDREIRRGDVFIPKDHRTKRQELVAMEFIREKEKIKCLKSNKVIVYVCPFRLTSGKADCYDKTKSGDGEAIWERTAPGPMDPFTLRMAAARF